MESVSFDLELMQQWVGREEVRADLIGVTPAAALAATLDHTTAPQPGSALPPLWHWIYFWTHCRESEIGTDGHPQRGGFLPPIPLPRRMWAGGRLTFPASLPIGAAATRSSKIKSISGKNGQSGQLAFVTVQHEIAADGVIAITEEHDIVYRNLSQSLPQPLSQRGAIAPAPKPAPTEALWRRTLTPDPVLLFRYSALTFNGHRIHYDRSYVTGVEGYPGLIVHGPLIATLLADLVRRHLPDARLTEFNFRAVGPLFDIEPFTLCGQPAADGRSVQLWAQNARGELAMQAEAKLAAPLSKQ